MFDLHQTCEAYQDQNGVMLDHDKIIDGNAVLYTGAKFVLLADQKALEADDLRAYLYMIASIEKEPGLIQRYEKPDDFEGHDNYVGSVVASPLLDNGNFARRVLSYGRKHFYSWNNLSPGTWSIRGFIVRHPGWWAMVKAAAGEWLNPFDQVSALINMSAIVFYENGSSGTLMSYLQYKTWVRQCSWWTEPLARLSCVIFKAAYLKRHPLGIKESYLEYFGPDYPFSQLPDGTF